LNSKSRGGVKTPFFWNTIDRVAEGLRPDAGRTAKVEKRRAISKDSVIQNRLGKKRKEGGKCSMG